MNSRPFVPAPPPPLLLLLLVTLAWFPAGCRSARPDAAGTAKPPYLGPTLPMADVARQIDERNQLIPTLWSRHYYEATIVDEDGKSFFVNGEGALLFRRPQHVLLVGSKELFGRVFEIGSTDEVYWLKVSEQLNTMWWGRHEHVGKPCVRKIPIAPNGLFEVLGVSTFNTDFTALPAPVMRFNNDADAYTFVWVARLPDRYAATKEIWYDRTTLLPTLVVLFDENGRVALRAFLSGHKPVEVPDVPPDRWPRVATRYKLFFPDTGTKMSFDLSDTVLDKNGVPTRKGIVFPGAGPDEAGVEKVIQLDEDCDK